jgi:hypothetical protein
VVRHVHILVRFLAGRAVSEGNYTMLSKWYCGCCRRRVYCGRQRQGRELRARRLPERLRVAWYRAG